MTNRNLQKKTPLSVTGNRNDNILVLTRKERLVRLENGRPGFESRFRSGSLSRWSHTSGLKTGTPVAALQAPGVTGSALGLAGPVSVYRDWARFEVWSATSISV